MKVIQVLSEDSITVLNGYFKDNNIDFEIVAEEDSSPAKWHSYVLLVVLFISR